VRVTWAVKNLPSLEVVNLVFPDCSKGVDTTPYGNFYESLAKLSKVKKIKLHMPSILVSGDLLVELSYSLSEMKGLDDCTLILRGPGNLIHTCYLIEGLSKLENLKTFQFILNDYNADKVEWIYFYNTLSKLKSVVNLTLGFNHGLTNYSLQKLTSTLEKLPQVENLSLQLGPFDNISDEVLNDFGMRLTSLKNLKKLSLSLHLSVKDGCSEEGLEELKQALLSHPDFLEKPEIKITLFSTSFRSKLPRRSEIQQHKTVKKDTRKDFFEN